MNKQDTSKTPSDHKSSAGSRLRRLIRSPQVEMPNVQRVRQKSNRMTEKKGTELSGQKTSKFFSAYWTIGSTLSILLNIILITALILVGQQLFELKRMVGEHLLAGLYANFVKMDQASIAVDVPVESEIPVQFPLQVATGTIVTLTEDTRIGGARVSLQTGGLNINNAPTSIILPAGTQLPIRLDLTVDVNTMVPVNLNVPVNIALKETELHEPFVGLQNVILPYYNLLQPDIRSWRDLPACKDNMTFCAWYFK